MTEPTLARSAPRTNRPPAIRPRAGGAAGNGPRDPATAAGFFVEIAIKVATERVVAAVLLLCTIVAGCAGRRSAAVALGAVCILQGCRALLWSVAYRNTRRTFQK